MEKSKDVRTMQKKKMMNLFHISYRPLSGAGLNRLPNAATPNKI